MVDLNAIISSTFAENTHVWVVLKGIIYIIENIIEDLEAMGMDMK